MEEIFLGKLDCKIESILKESLPESTFDGVRFIGPSSISQRI